MNYTFRRRTSNLPENIDMQKTFTANGSLEALQMASDYWFGGETVIDWIQDRDGVITLRSNSNSGNVIGTLMGEL